MQNVLAEAGKKVVLLGNEAIVRGCLEAGVSFASTYPGTPASEIGDTFSSIAKKLGVYFEYSTNEKVALEAAAAASLSGLRSIVAMKHFGLNVASDSLIPLPYFETSGLLVVSADDPSCWSSAQSEQDSRWYAKLAKLPLLEPSDPQECKDFAKLAYQISEEFKIPVLLRTTTRVAHCRGVVELGEIRTSRKKGKFEKNKQRFFNLRPQILRLHQKVLEKIEGLKKFAEQTELNKVFNGSRAKLGIVASGTGFNYVMEALQSLNIKIPVLKLGLTHPLPQQKIKNFAKNFKRLLIVEELDPFVENEMRLLLGSRLEIHGKDLLPSVGELNPTLVEEAISKLVGKKVSTMRKELQVAKRLPALCAGCPHRATFYAIKSIAKDAVFCGDIGCYMLGIFPPLETQDLIVSMGASLGFAHGFGKATDQKVVAFVGDSTFLHAGIPALLNIVYNKSSPLVVILDNRITAMTGAQPNPASGRTGMGEEVEPVDIEEIARACGIKDVRVVDPFNLKAMQAVAEEFLSKKRPCVIVARRECQRIAVRRMKKEGKKIPKFRIDEKKCKRCGACARVFGCPAIREQGGKFVIDEDLCTGCGVCAQVCPFTAIRKV